MNPTDQFTREQIEEILSHGAVGIDLGTTYSAVAAINEAGQIEVLKNSEGRLTTPSVVLFDEDGKTLVGEQARQLGQGQPSRVVECTKRFMGNTDVKWDIDGHAYTPEDISAIILAKLVRDASASLGRAVRTAVITVPAWFNDDARQATLRAGEQAGLNVLGILSEPSAAALAYGFAGHRNKMALVYDLGGGTFDLSLIRISGEGQVTELVRDGDVMLGGKDWDQTLVDHAAGAFQRTHGFELPSESDAYMTLTLEAEKAKMRLSESKQARLFVQHAGRKLSLRVTREEFESWTSALLARTGETVNVVLGCAKLKPDQIDAVLPVGGMTKAPQVKAMLERIFGPHRLDQSLEKDLVVAVGACLYMVKRLLDLLDQVGGKLPAAPDAVGLSRLPEAKRIAIQRSSLVQVSSRTYGIVVHRQDGPSQVFNDHFVKRNQSLGPRGLQIRKTYYTVVPDQEILTVDLLEGDSAVVAECRKVAERTCLLPPGLPERSPLHYTFTFTEEGLIRVHVFEPVSGRTFELVHKGTNRDQAKSEAVRKAIQALS